MDGLRGSVCVIMFKKFKRISDKDKILLGLFHNLQSNWNNDFQENALQEYYKNGGWLWFWYFNAKDILLLKQTTIRIKSLKLFIFDLLKRHAICFHLYKL